MNSFCIAAVFLQMSYGMLMLLINMYQSIPSLQVWEIRVDLHVLNHDGNIIDCASVAAIAALAHFK